MGAPCAMVRWIPRTKRGPWTLPPCWDTKRKHGREEQPDLFWCFKGAGAMWNIWIFSEYLKSESQNIWSAGLSQQLGTGNFFAQLANIWGWGETCETTNKGVMFPWCAAWLLAVHRTSKIGIRTARAGWQNSREGYPSLSKSRVQVKVCFLQS